MNAKETCRMLGITLLPATMIACLYLERHGLRFAIDFGYDNAIELARDHRRKRRNRENR